MLKETSIPRAVSLAVISAIKTVGEIGAGIGAVSCALTNGVSTTSAPSPTAMRVARINARM